MPRKNLQKRLKDFRKIQDAIEVSKFSLMQQIAIKKNLSHISFQTSLVAKEIFDFISKTYSIQSKMNESQDSKGVLWIFVTNSKTFLSMNYSGKQRTLLKHFNKIGDSLICIGQPAINYAEKIGIEPIFTSEFINEEVSRKISWFINSLHLENKVNTTRFLVNTNLSSEDWITVLPITELKLNIEGLPFELDRKVKFMPSIIDAVSTISSLYIDKMTFALLEEAEFYYLKQKLMRHESSLDAIEEKVTKLKFDSFKTRRQKETDELIMISQNSRRRKGDG